MIRDSDQATRLSKIDELQKQGMIVDWCSQAMVLSRDEHIDPIPVTEPEPYRYRTETVPSPDIWYGTGTTK